MKRIPFTITLSGLDAESSDLRVRVKGDNTRAANSPTIEIMATRISDAKSESVPLKFAPLGVSKILDSVSVTGRLEIPVEEEKRKEDIDEYFKKIEAASRKEGKEAEFKHLTRNRQAALAIYESMYVDNRVGEFEITCQYNPVRPAQPHGTIKSSPVRVQVVFEGKFFDQPKFKLN